MLSNAYFLAKFRFDTAENKSAKNLQNFAKFANFADPFPLTRREAHLLLALFVILLALALASSGLAYSSEGQLPSECTRRNAV